jgi:hypothetical protein
VIRDQWQRDVGLRGREMAGGAQVVHEQRQVGVVVQGREMAGAPHELQGQRQRAVPIQGGVVGGAVEEEPVKELASMKKLVAEGADASDGNVLTNSVVDEIPLEGEVILGENLLDSQIVGNLKSLGKEKVGDNNWDQGGQWWGSYWGVSGMACSRSHGGAICLSYLW